MEDFFFVIALSLFGSSFPGIHDFLNLTSFSFLHMLKILTI